MTDSSIQRPAAPPNELYLASRSPRRLELLAQLGVRPTLVSAEADERPLERESPAAYVARIAAAKAHAGWATLCDAITRPLLAADTAVVIGDQILGKPADADSALQMLALLSGRHHRVLTAVTLLAPSRAEAQGVQDQPLERQVVVETEVLMRRITPDEALAYWVCGEPLDKAGAYAIQGRGAIFVEDICGSYSNVVGLPLFETAALLREQGIDPLAH